MSKVKYLMGLIGPVIQCVIYMFVGLALFAYFFSNALMYHPPRHVVFAQAYDQPLRLASGVTIMTRFIPNPKARYTFLVSHGNAEDLKTLTPFLDQMVAQGYQVMAYDYPGYGLSQGKPNEQSTYEAIRGVYHALVHKKGVSPSRIILFGHSLGSGPSFYLASRHKVAGMIVEGAFLSAFRVMTHVKLLPFDRYDNLKRLSSIDCPILFIHGRLDKVVPFWHGQTLYRKYQGPKTRYWVADAGHNNLRQMTGHHFWKVIAHWLKRDVSGQWKDHNRRGPHV